MGWQLWGYGLLCRMPDVCGMMACMETGGLHLLLPPWRFWAETLFFFCLSYLAQVSKVDEVQDTTSETALRACTTPSQPSPVANFSFISSSSILVH